MALRLLRSPNKKAHTAAPAESRAAIPSRRSIIPLINRLSLRWQTRILLAVLAVSLACSACFSWQGSRNYLHSTLQAHITSGLAMHTQRIGKAVPNAIRGNQEAFAQLAESRGEFNRGLALLLAGGTYEGAVIGPPSAAMRPILDDVRKLWQHTDQAADTILKLNRELVKFGVTLKRLNAMLPSLLDLSEQISAAQSRTAASPREMAAAGQLVLLTLRLGRGANEFLTADGVNSETAFLLGKDVNAYHDIIHGFLDGSELLHLRAVDDKDVRAKLVELENMFSEYRPQVAGVLGNLQEFIAVKQAEQLVARENETLKRLLSVLERDYRVAQGARAWSFWVMLAAMACALLSAIGIALVQLQNSRNNAVDAEARRRQAEAQRLLAQQQEEVAMRANLANQTAILRLMNELQKVADGDLTAHTTVSEDITGAIADSINHTVEALRALVEQVTQMASKVSATSSHVRTTTVELANAARIQARRIEDTGQSMLRMSQRITGISVSATESADVARHSVVVAQRGAQAVEEAVKAMNEIREQIQETSKRIKRLGESSQVIGEITELISDITEQTNVLALNAAIQAASAGEAGRGFSVVAEEVQRLAERSSVATREIGALVRMIQTDTHDAVAAMEKSTAGVVEGAVLSDAAGVALSDIRSVSSQLAELIEGMSVSTAEQAVSASGVARNIESILSENAIIEKSREQVGALYNELWDAALQLEGSVSRFRVTVPHNRLS